jgi:hypothetical protein
MGPEVVGTQTSHISPRPPAPTAELDRLAGLEPRDDLRVRLEQRQQLLTNRDGRPLEDPPRRLPDPLLQSRQEQPHLLGQATCLLLRGSLQRLQNSPGLRARPLRRRDQMDRGDGPGSSDPMTAVRRRCFTVVKNVTPRSGTRKASF